MAFILLPNIISSIVIGTVCGLIVSMIIKTQKSILLNIFMGIIGSIIAGLLFTCTEFLLGMIIAINGILRIIPYYLYRILGACLLILTTRNIKK